MKSRDFVYWLQGYFELLNDDEGELPILNTTQTLCIRNHLAMVFTHEIDPEMGDKAHQEALNNIHSKAKPSSTGESLYRC